MLQTNKTKIVASRHHSPKLNGLRADSRTRFLGFRTSCGNSAFWFSWCLCKRPSENKTTIRVDRVGNRLFFVFPDLRRWPLSEYAFIFLVVGTILWLLRCCSTWTCQETRCRPGKLGKVGEFCRNVRKKLIMFIVNTMLILWSRKCGSFIFNCVGFNMFVFFRDRNSFPIVI